MAKYNYFPNDVAGTLYFTHFDSRDINGKFSFELGNLSEAAVEMLSKGGAKVKYVEDDKYGRGHYVGVTSSYPWEIELTEGLELDEGKDIGNGSTAQITFATYHHGRAHNNGIGLTALGKILLTSYVPYDASEAAEDRPRKQAI